MLFVINPTAARGRASREWSKAQLELRKRGVKFREHRTTQPGEACEVTRQALLEGEVCVIAVGGDGTLNEVVSGYFDQFDQPINPQATIGLLPCGTGSDFRRSVGLRNREIALRAIVAGNSRLIDLIKIELTGQDGQPVSRYSVNVISFGLGGEVVRLVNSWRYTLPSWVWGHARFVLAALKALGAYRNHWIQISFEDRQNAKEICSNFLVVANGRFAGGGMKFAPQAELDDGLMDVVLIDNASRLDILKELPRIRFGWHLRNPKVKSLQAASVFIGASCPLPVDVDGESVGFTPAKLTLQPSALRFVVGTLSNES